MRLISLNAWGGRVFEPLMEFIREEAPRTDIFCFQELYFSETPRDMSFGVRADLAVLIKKLLPDFVMFERHAEMDIPSTYIKDLAVGEAIFVRNSIGVRESGGFRTFAQDSESEREAIAPESGNFNYVKIRAGSGDVLVGNIHGLWAGGKSDTPKRLEQSRRIMDLCEKNDGKKIIVGDFNLRPDTESVAIIGRDMKNLVKEYGVLSTRNRHYADMNKYADYIADYIFISNDVMVEDFRVFPNEVSDHLPLVLEFQ